MTACRIVILGFVVFLVGCSTILAVKDQQRRADTTAVLAGTVSTAEPARGPLVVTLLARANDDYVLVDWFTAPKAGPWVFGVQPGTYWIAAFEDVNGDGACDDEPVVRPDLAHPFVLEPGARVANVDLVIRRNVRALRAGRLVLRDLVQSGDQQQSKSLYALGVAGKVATLADPRFDPAMGQEGMWQYYDFLLSAEAGIYFLEPYDPQRIPVLFVHGIGGTPRDFEHLVQSLDRRRFQPWVAYYPTGGRLDVAVPWLDQLFTRLQVELGFREVVVVAHSMGGLVARGFVLHHDASDPHHVVTMLVTISSPLGGMASAGEGVAKSPVVVRSWYGLAPGSDYLEGLYYEDPKTHTKRRRLPARIAYHLMFGFKGGGRDGSSDGVVSVASQLRPEAQEEARTIRGFDEDHTSILASPAVAAHLAEILAPAR
jgi:pimeloyl-ACP methyl ester carboxylesterase